MKPKLSILITSYNKEKYISYILNMLKEQNCDDIIIYIADDCSTDNSINIIEEIISDILNFHLIKMEENKGTGYIREYLMQLVDTEYFIFMDADDMITENYISKIIEYIGDKNPDIHRFDVRVYPLGGKAAFDFALWDAVFKTSFIKENNLHFNTSLTNMEDFYFRRDIEKTNFKEVWHHDVLYIYNILEDNTLTHEKGIWYNHNLNGMREECEVE